MIYMDFAGQFEWDIANESLQRAHGFTKDLLILKENYFYMDILQEMSLLHQANAD